jgi:lipopolysaccharide export system permease protein
VRGIGNEFQKTQNDSFKGEREMSVCEMQRNEAVARKEFLNARKDFLAKMKLAKERKIKLSKEVLATRTDVPVDVGIGSAYCALLKKTKVKELAAQTPVQDSVKARTDSIRASIEADSKRATAPPVLDSAGRVANPVTRGPITAGRVPVGVGRTPAQIDRGVTLPPPSAGFPSPPERGIRPPVVPPATGAAPSTGVVNPAPGSPIDTASASNKIPNEVIPAQVEETRLRVMDTLRSLNRYEVEIQKKFALAAACFIFVLLGAPIALRFPRAGVGLTIGVSLVVFGIYYVGLIAGESLARRGIVPPVVSMWIANVVFGVIALILLARMGNESGSSRGGDIREVIDNIRYRFRRSPAASVVPRSTRTKSS